VEKYNRAVQAAEKFFQTKVVEKIKTHILCPKVFFKTMPFMRNNVKKYSRAVQDTEKYFRQKL
jgi:hypothetical protein